MYGWRKSAHSGTRVDEVIYDLPCCFGTRVSACPETAKQFGSSACHFFFSVRFVVPRLAKERKLGRYNARNEPHKIAWRGTCLKIQGLYMND